MPNRCGQTHGRRLSDFDGSLVGVSPGHATPPKRPQSPDCTQRTKDLHPHRCRSPNLGQARAHTNTLPARQRPGCGNTRSGPLADARLTQPEAPSSADRLSGRGHAADGSAPRPAARFPSQTRPGWVAWSAAQPLRLAAPRQRSPVVYQDRSGCRRRALRRQGVRQRRPATGSTVRSRQSSRSRCPALPVGPAPRAG